MTMTKKQARAIVACAAKIEKALDACIAQLADDELTYAESYWAAHVRNIIRGQGYGSMPLGEAQFKSNPNEY